MAHWAIDLGTTNTALATWDEERERPAILALPQICRSVEADDPLEAPRLVPSATHMLPGDDFWTRVGRNPLVQGWTFWGKQAIVGRPALDKNQSRVHPNFVRSWKPYLGRESLRVIARAGKQKFSAREVAKSFVRELFARVKTVHGERIRELTVTAPVDAYEAYRAEVGQLLKSVGVRKIRFVDEPVAAAAGYGISAAGKRVVLVVDFGGGTLDLALVRLDARGMEAGQCTVIAKTGRAIGGNLVDEWLLDDFCRRLDYRLPNTGNDDDTFWYRLMLQEARWVKEQLFFKDKETFWLRPPEEMRAYHARVHGEDPHLQVDTPYMIDILRSRGMYTALEECTDEVLTQAREAGMSESDIDDVLMVGGSTLLPGVFKHFEGAFGRDRVRGWQPFEAVVYGACGLTAKGFEQSDFIVHDYAFVVYDQKTNERQYEVIVPKGTRFPTPPDIWRRQLVPTCALGEPERIFKLVICEVGSARDGERAFGWDAEGKLHKLGKEDGRLVVALNDANPTLGYLNPPHPPSDRNPRLDVSFGVNADRWLCATVQDLKSSRTLLKNEPVVRLL